MTDINPLSVLVPLGAIWFYRRFEAARARAPRAEFSSRPMVDFKHYSGILDKIKEYSPFRSLAPRRGRDGDDRHYLLAPSGAVVHHHRSVPIV